MAGHGIWMPFYWGDYFGKTSGLSCEEHGAYLLLLGAYWQRGRSLPDDDRYLATATRNSLKKWKIIRPKIIEYFSQKDGELVHDRIEKELLRSSERITSARANGRAGGVAKAKLVTVTVTSTEEVKETPSLRSVVPAKRKTKRALPDIFPLETDREWARIHWLKYGRVDLCNDMGNQEVLFRDHHSSKLTFSADWSASWRTWAQNAIKFTNGGHSGRAQPRKSAHQKFAEGAYLAATEDEPGMENGSFSQPDAPLYPLLEAGFRAKPD